ncbi:Hsp20/alpha crystallin family protein [Rhodohalobacter sulfatireducens]|uniref:Hsp20/alpha crystallin family protein n=1 Tax=Rhodohalobacter sulfatireducens TaxID=2911366 RepID=A0ABS9KBZ9_9BACT|nr:Hsp20/alpha crystallin family protein [Rhodohalobacter sulfatireducens]MCG2588385.1 Hsp20/alpha crystallin family protein [Rhodohalobacter sulfatireducens]
MSNLNIDLEKQLSRLGKDIQGLVERMVPLTVEAGDFKPDCDIVESEKMYSLYMDLPGMKKKDIKITLKDRILTVSGERELFLEDDEELKRSERTQGSFSRSFALPENADVSSVDATFKEGVLQVKILKAGLENDDDSQSIPIN